MDWFSGLLNLVNAIMDRLPSRREALLNQIQETKDAIKDLQKTKPWTALASGQYYALDDKLQSLEKRAANLG